MTISPKTQIAKYIFFILGFISLFLPPALSLLLGIIWGISFTNPIPKTSKKLSTYLLQTAVVLLGLGMNIFKALESGKNGMLFTVISVIGVMLLGILIGTLFKVGKKRSYLIASGTAICGGSAIAAVGPVIDADDDDMSLSLATIFVLNAIALFIFPPIGNWLCMTQAQFGTWAAIAIHDTSSVVGAGAAFGLEAQEIATTIKLTRALWIIPLSLISVLIFRSKGKVKLPLFIVFFIIAMIINTYLTLPESIATPVKWLAKHLLSASLFFIGSGLSRKTLANVGFRPLVLGITLWIIISVTAYFASISFVS